MVRRRPNPHSLISPVEAERAIYVDCEGFTDKSPSLIGVLIGDGIEQIVLDSELQRVAIARHHRLASFSAEAARLHQLSTQENRVIVAYSQHERNLFFYSRADRYQ